MMNAGWAEEEEEAAAPSPGSIPAAGPRTAVDIVVGAGLAFLRAGCCTVLSGCSGGDAVADAADAAETSTTAGASAGGGAASAAHTRGGNVGEW